MLDNGEEGKIKKPSGKEVDNLYYLVLEYVPEGILYDVVEYFGGVGEDGGRFFMK
jgi:DNA-binding protein Fis